MTFAASQWKDDQIILKVGVWIICTLYVGIPSTAVTVATVLYVQRRLFAVAMVNMRFASLQWSRQTHMQEEEMQFFQRLLQQCWWSEVVK